MSAETEGGFGPVLANSNFRRLWIAQLLTQIAQSAVNFVQMALIEQLTHSTILLAVMILAFTLPGVIFSPVAGVVVDRFPKKWVLVGSNLIRVGLSVAYLPFLAGGQGTWELLAIYVISFVAASVAQFFAPAEAATIPLLVGEDRLLAANSLFNLTMALSQVVGLLMLGPLIVTVVGYQGGFLLVACAYLAATVLSAQIPRDQTSHQAAGGAEESGWAKMWQEARDGWQFVSHQRNVREATAHMVTINTLVMVLAMIAPGFANRVLGLSAQGAVLVFAPAGAGMLLATGITGRWGYWLRRYGSVYIGLVLVGLAFGLLGTLSLDYQGAPQVILRAYSHMTISMTGATMFLAFFLGLGLSGVNILAQTTIQEESPAKLRGRVFATLYMLNALVGIPPMLLLGELADRYGIPQVMIIIGVVTLLVAGVTILDRRYGSLGAAFSTTRRHISRPAPGHVEPQVPEDVNENLEEVRQ
jgi:MFS family permease